MRDSNNAHGGGMMRSFKFLTQKDGVFAEFFSVNNADSNLVLKPENVSIDDALMTTDMMSTGFYGAELAKIQIGDTVVVFGIGPVGLMAIAGARALGAGKIIANDRVHPGKMLNYKYEGFDKIPEAFKVMDEKPRDLIKSCVYINWD